MKIQRTLDISSEDETVEMNMDVPAGDKDPPFYYTIIVNKADFVKNMRKKGDFEAYWAEVGKKVLEDIAEKRLLEEI